MNDHIQYSPDTEAAGGGTEAQSDDLNFENPAEEMQAEQEQESAAEEEPAAEPATEEGGESTETEESKEGESEEQESFEETNEESAENSETEEGSEESEETSAEDKTQKPVLALPSTEGDEETDSWKDLGSRQGFDVTDDSIEAYEEAQSTFINEKIEEAVGKATEGLISLTDLDPSVQNIIRWAQANEEADVSGYLQQISEYDTLINLSDEALVREQLKAQNFSEDQIERQVEELNDQGKIDLTARHTRNKLEEAKTAHQEQMQANIQEAEELRETELVQQAEQELEAIGDSLNKRQDFMGFSITDEHRNYVRQKFSDGDYDHFRNDPERFVDLVMYHEFGQNAAKELHSKAFNQGKDKIVDRMANSPEAVTQGGESSKSTDKNRQERTGTFEDWESGVPAEMRSST